VFIFKAVVFSLRVVAKSYKKMSMAGEMLGEKNQEKLFSIILKREEN